MKTLNLVRIAAGLASLALTAHASDPLLNSWYTNYSGRYARIYTNATMQASGNAITTWSNGSQTQSTPAYSGVQEIYSSSNWVYVRATSLASYTMGPWQTGFPNLPANQKYLYRIPRVTGTNNVPTTKTANNGGTIGLFVDGVAMFNSWDAFYWNGTTETSGAGTGYWNRDAYVNEGATFDPGYAHQQNTGTYHYHANPIGLRYLLGDHVDFNSSAKTFSESTNAVTKHSPILGWVADGFPIYGPYAYSNALDASSPIVRMQTGYQLRNGSKGSDNLASILVRTNLPAWSKRLFNTNSSGPSVSGTYPLGRYMEDYSYLGDLTNSATGTNYRQGVDFDLDEFNGRFCHTPEFPGGIYAYFVSMSSNGTPVFPYNIGRGYYGNPTGGNPGNTIIDTVTNVYLCTSNATLARPTIKNGNITLTWNALEGGTYRVETSSNLTSWTTLNASVAAQQNVGSVTNPVSGSSAFYRAAVTSLATFDSAGTTAIINGGISVSAPGGSASVGQTVLMTITLPTNPPLPPADRVPASITLAGTISGSNISRPSSGTAFAVFAIPTNAPTGLQNIVVTFSPAPTYTMTGAFTINP